MHKHIIQISFVFSILLLAACSQPDNSETAAISEGNYSPSQGHKDPIPYPAIFSDKKVPMIPGAFVLNSKELENTKNKTGMQNWERVGKSFEEVKAYYLENLPKNGWERKTDADKQSSPEEEADKEPVKYFVTKFLREEPAEKKRYVLLLNITAGNDGNTTVIKIIKEM